MSASFVMAVHGGAGNLKLNKATSGKKAYYTRLLQKTLDAGYRVLEKGGTSLDAVEASVRVMEDEPFFNAGKGSVLTSEGKNEMDASIMNGKNLNAGAVASTTTIRNPVSAARCVMEKSSHVLLVGKGAEEFIKKQGLDMVLPQYFFTEKRYKALKRLREREEDGQELDHTGEDEPDEGDGISYSDPENSKFGTVGAVALDKYGDLAAGTSTGGMTNKRYGRVGDSPVIGAGTYANNHTCAVSGTGHGEFFLRAVVAHEVSALMDYKKLSLEEAAREVIFEKVKTLGGLGGLIAIDRRGNIAMPFSTSALFRAFRKSTGEEGVAVFKD